MKLSDLVSRFRIDADDAVEPFRWSDDHVIAWLNDAESEAAMRGRLIHESDNDEVCLIAVTAGTASYALHTAAFEIDHIEFTSADGQSTQLALVSTEWLDANVTDWRKEQGTPRYGVQTDTSLRLVPKPDADGEVRLECYRLPLEAMAEDDDTPEIGAAHHVHLVHWALFKAFTVPDSETIDKTRAAMAEREFSNYFGERTDADLRRSTRHDTPHHNTPFWV